MNLLPHNFREKIVFALSTLLSRWINRDKNIKTIPVQNILVFKLDEIGDLCYSLHVFDLLKQKYNGAHITLVCKPYCISLVHSHPSIDEVITSVSELTAQYQLIVDLRGNFDTLRYAFFHRPKIRVDRGTVRLQNKRKGGHPHEVLTNTQIIAPLMNDMPINPMPRIIAPPQAHQKVTAYLAQNNIHKFVVMHCGARRILRRWPAANFAALAHWLKQSYGFDCIFTGDTHDITLVQQIQLLIPFKTYNTCGTFNLIEFAALVQKATLYVGNESGPLCIASVSGTASVGLFGPGEPVVFYPYGPKTAYLHHVLPCNPCDQVHCVHPDNPCIQRISIEEVKLKIVELLKD